MIGQTIAHYRITAKLGSAGMGDVYRARGIKLLKLQQLLKGFDAHSGILDDSTHRVGINRIVAGNGDEGTSVRHHDVLAAFADLHEASLLQRPNGAEMRNAGQLGHVLECNFDFPNQGRWDRFSDSGQILANGVLYVFQSFRLGLPLRPTTRQTWTGNREAFRGWVEDNFVSHVTRSYYSRH
jgi:hypothetical protein